MKKKKEKFKDFKLVEGTAGVILDGVYLKKDKSEVIICSPFWSGKHLHFKPLSEEEKSL